MVFSSEAKVTRSKFLPTTFPLFYATSTPTITYTAAVPQKDHDSLNQVCTTYASSFFLTECHSVLYNTMDLLPNSFVGKLKAKLTFLPIDVLHIHTCLNELTFHPIRVSSIYRVLVAKFGTRAIYSETHILSSQFSFQFVNK